MDMDPPNRLAEESARDRRNCRALSVFRWWTFSMCLKLQRTSSSTCIVVFFLASVRHAKAKGGEPRAHKFRIRCLSSSYHPHPHPPPTPPLIASTFRVVSLFYGGDEIWLISFTLYSIFYYFRSARDCWPHTLDIPARDDPSGSSANDLSAGPGCRRRV